MFPGCSLHGVLGAVADVPTCRHELSDSNVGCTWPIKHKGARIQGQQFQPSKWALIMGCQHMRVLASRSLTGVCVCLAKLLKD